MSKTCLKCSSDLGILSLFNYGNDNFPLCYDCSASSKCAKCGTVVSVDKKRFFQNKAFCIDCFQTIPQDSFWIVIRKGPELSNETQYLEQLISKYSSSLTSPEKIRLISDDLADISNKYFRAAILVKVTKEWGIDLDIENNDIIYTSYKDDDGYPGIIISTK